LRIGRHEPGSENAITDVSGVAVGHVTVWRDEPDPPVGRGVGRSGVTVVVPGEPAKLTGAPVRAGVAVLNGAGELTGSHEIREWGTLETPIYLTATMAVGRVYDGAVAAAVAADPSVGIDDVVIPVVGECDDSWLSEARVVQVEAEDAGRVLAVATGGPVAEGAVGAGTGMVAFGLKGGIGTASRLLPDGSTLGVLVLANFGVRRNLVVDGVPAGEVLDGEDARGHGDGSCIAIVATDAALVSHDLSRVARRCGLGLARTGSVAYDGSGEIFLAFSTSREGGESDGRPPVNELFEATVEATEEAVLNALWAAPEVTGREGRVVPALPHEPVLALLREHGRLS
jgi:D-aminopeptidase